MKGHVAALQDEMIDVIDPGRKNEIHFQLMLLGETPAMAEAGLVA